MEGKSMVKLSHMVVFLLLASMFQLLTARDVRDEKEVLRLPVAKENQVEPSADDDCYGKHLWPELVGKQAWSAKKTIEKENPAAKVVVLLPDMFRPSNIECGRVFVDVNWSLIVRKTPTMEVCCLTEAHTHGNLKAFETLMAQKERAKVSDELEVVQLLKELKSVDESNLVCKGKQMWPELIGVPANLAEAIVKKENSFISEVQIILNGSPVTTDFSCFRVRLFVNILNDVLQMPVVG